MHGFFVNGFACLSLRFCHATCIVTRTILISCELTSPIIVIALNAGRPVAENRYPYANVWLFAASHYFHHVLIMFAGLVVRYFVFIQHVVLSVNFYKSQQESLFFLAACKF
jgi:hypothetical protein